jgi:ubiquitin C-terminal hydrolase
MRDSDMENTTYRRSPRDLMRKKMNDEWMRINHKEYSEIIPIFYGQTISQIKCCYCDKLHHNMDVLSVLMVPLVGKSLGDCLQQTLEDEVLETKCDACGRVGRNTRSWMIWRYPRVLVICLKRFTDDLQKNNSSMMIEEVLELDNKTFTLMAVANHVGCYGGGHYFSFCKMGDSWYEIDDDSVKNLGSKMPSMQYCYMLFYESSTNS